MEQLHKSDSPLTHGGVNVPDMFKEADELQQKADALREQAIQSLIARRQALLAECQTINEQLQKNGYLDSNGTHNRVNGHAPKTHGPSQKRFATMKLADIGVTLLKEYESLHGTEIEQMAKAGGFKSKTDQFQNLLQVTFKRHGGFRNVGKNTWRLTEHFKANGGQSLT